MKSVIIIDESGKCKLKEMDFKKENMLKIVDDTHVDHVSLLALEYKGLYLGMYVGDFSRMKKGLNRVATKINKYLRKMCKVMDKSSMELYGPVILYDDNGNLSSKEWKMVQDVIKSKKQKLIPQDLLDHLTEVDAEIPLADKDKVCSDAADTSSFMMSMYNNFGQKISEYGKIYK